MCAFVDIAKQHLTFSGQTRIGHFAHVQLLIFLTIYFPPSYSSKIRGKQKVEIFKYVSMIKLKCDNG